ncbi:MAG: hypothetical protein Q7S48_04400 [bacterium]|nr:hypothetical protein [bacterium]
MRNFTLFLALAATIILFGNTAFAQPVAPPCQAGMTCTTTYLTVSPMIAPAIVEPAETCTMGWCPFTTAASYIGAGGVLGLEIIGIVAVLLTAAYFFFRWLPERFRRDRKWNKKAARLNGRWRSAARRSAAEPDDMDLVESMETAWARYIGFTMQVRCDDADDVELPPPPPAI